MVLLIPLETLGRRRYHIAVQAPSCGIENYKLIMILQPQAATYAAAVSWVVGVAIGHKAMP